jgi:sterol desaturase/sphingolipid hydroxylase (fatty acid hydroxylase superfamily)
MSLATAPSSAAPGHIARGPGGRPAAADRPPRPPRALSEHAARVQDHLALTDGIGSWVLAATSGAVLAAAAGSAAGVPRRASSAAALPAGALGAMLASYTGRLLADTSVRAWHEARHELPFMFAGSTMGQRRRGRRWP